MFSVGDPVVVNGRHFVVVGYSGNRYVLMDDEGQKLVRSL